MSQDKDKSTSTDQGSGSTRKNPKWVHDKELNMNRAKEMLLTVKKGLEDVLDKEKSELERYQETLESITPKR